MNSAITLYPFQRFRLFEDAASRLASEPRAPRPWSPAVDIVETEAAVTLTADLPAVNPEDIDIQVENGTLTLKGHRNFEKNESAKGYQRFERTFGEFARSFSVPNTVETDKVGADYKNGVLTITLPKKETAKPRQVKVEVQA